MTFDYPGYAIKFIQKEPCNDASAHLYTLIFKFFSPVTKYHYIIRAEYHSGDFFALKFYCKKDKRSEYKYSKIINKGDIGNILITCLKVIPLLLQYYPTASFGFSGARTYDSVSKKIEPYYLTQRYKIYKEIIPTKIGNKTFEHKAYNDISCYMMINRKSGDVIKREIELKSVLQETYENLLNEF